MNNNKLNGKSLVTDEINVTLDEMDALYEERDVDPIEICKYSFDDVLSKKNYLLEYCTLEIALTALTLLNNDYHIKNHLYTDIHNLLDKCINNRDCMNILLEAYTALYEDDEDDEDAVVYTRKLNHRMAYKMILKSDKPIDLLHYFHVDARKHWLTSKVKYPFDLFFTDYSILHFLATNNQLITCTYDEISALFHEIVSLDNSCVNDKDKNGDTPLTLSIDHA